MVHTHRVPEIYLCTETQDRGYNVLSWERAQKHCFLGNTCILATWWMCIQLCEEDGTRQLSFFVSVNHYRNHLKKNFWVNEKTKKNPILLHPLERYWKVRQKHTFAFQVLSRALWLTVANYWCTKPGALEAGEQCGAGKSLPHQPPTVWPWDSHVISFCISASCSEYALSMYTGFSAVRTSPWHLLV